MNSRPFQLAFLASPIVLKPIELEGANSPELRFWFPEIEVGALVAGGLLLAVFLGLLGRLSALLPMKRRRRERWKRIQPIIALLVGVAYLIFALRLVLRHAEAAQSAGVLAITLAVVAAFWFALRDVVSGVVLKAGRVCQVGDQVRLGKTEGRIDSMGLRSLTVETRKGEEAVIPYGRLTREAIFRTPVIEGSVLYVFRLKARSDSSASDVRRAIIERALSCHWSSIVRQPLVKALGSTEYEVTVFALHSDYGPEIEALVRRSPVFAPTLS